MSDHAFYLTIAYAVTALLLFAELLLLRVQGQRIKRDSAAIIDAKSDIQTEG